MTNPSEKSQVSADWGKLPIDDVLEDIRTTLSTSRRLVIEAPPGAGKTTRVPLALDGAPWVAGRRIVMLEPRRLAARAAAERMAAALGERVGRTVGVTTRFDRRTGPETRIEVVTEGILTRRLQADPSLDGVAAILFDEFHERSLQGDLGLALALEAQDALRDDLAIVVMSATLDGVAVADLLGGAPVIRADGHMFPVETRYRPPPAPRGRSGDPVLYLTAIVDEALAADPGSILAFLPGQGEIRRAAADLAARGLSADIDIMPLYGDLPAEQQAAAISPSPPGRRKVVLATTIAETSLTIEGIRIVIDTGLKRAPQFDPSVGLSRLVTVGVSRAAADQRRGRAGRTAAGVCYRLWAEAAHGALPAYDRPEILDADLAGLALDLACWGLSDPASLAWLDPPPETAWLAARALLARLGALDSAGRITPHGRSLAEVPLHPRLAHMVLSAEGEAERRLAVVLAGLLDERDLTAIPGADITERVRRLAGNERSAPADKGVRDRIGRLVSRLKALTGAERAGGAVFANLPLDSVGPLVATAYPDRVARRRKADGGGYLLANGRGGALDAGDPLAKAQYLAVADMTGDRRTGRIRRAVGLEAATVERLFADRIIDAVEVRWDDERGNLVARDVRRLDALVLAEIGRPVPADGRAVDAMLAMIRVKGLRCLPWTDAARRLQARVAFARAHDGADLWPDISDAALTEGLEDWLGPMLPGVTAAGDLARLDMTALITHCLSWDEKRALDRRFPDALPVPSGRSVSVDYDADGGPVLSVRLQEVFGLDQSPHVGDGQVPVTVALLSPAGRPIQVTSDLAGFWRGSYAEVRRDMRGRYPKHDWPEDPTAATASRHGRKMRS